MPERTFDFLPAKGPDDDEATGRVADLAERILEEVSRAGHSWQTIDALAAALARLTAQMAAGSAEPC